MRHLQNVRLLTVEKAQVSLEERRHSSPWRGSYQVAPTFDVHLGEFLHSPPIHTATGERRSRFWHLFRMTHALTLPSLFLWQENELQER